MRPTWQESSTVGTRSWNQCDYTSCCVGARKLVQGSNRVGWGGQSVSNKNGNNAKTGTVLRGVVSMPARYTWREVSIATDPWISGSRWEALQEGTLRGELEKLNLKVRWGRLRWMAICLWDTWICHSLSNIEVCANASGNMSKHQPARKRLKKSTLAASALTCCVFICTNLEQTRNTRPIGHFTMAGTLQVAKLWHAGFSYVQTSSKPCSNLKSMGPDDASRCDRILKESSINFFFCARQL